MKKLCCALLSFMVAAVSIGNADAAKRPHRGKIVGTYTCITIEVKSPLDFYVYNSCMNAIKVSVTWSNGEAVDYTVRAQPGPGTPARTIRKRADRLAIRYELNFPLMTGGSMLGSMSPDHINNANWGYTNYSDQYVFAYLKTADDQIIGMNFPAHKRISYIANVPITAIYAERDPD